MGETLTRVLVLIVLVLVRMVIGALSGAPRSQHKEGTIRLTTNLVRLSVTAALDTCWAIGTNVAAAGLST